MGSITTMAASAKRATICKRRRRPAAHQSGDTDSPARSGAYAASLRDTNSVKSRTRLVLRVSPCVRSQSVPPTAGCRPDYGRRPGEADRRASSKSTNHISCSYSLRRRGRRFRRRTKKPPARCSAAPTCGRPATPPRAGIACRHLACAIRKGRWPLNCARRCSSGLQRAAFRIAGVDCLGHHG
jgi:hypothetical protein